MPKSQENKSDRIAALMNSLRGLQLLTDYSDLELVCGSKTFYVHKAVVCPRSTYLAAACRWKQNQAQKAQICLNDENATVIALMVDYFYQLDYKDDIKIELPPVRTMNTCTCSTEGQAIFSNINIPWATFGTDTPTKAASDGATGFDSNAFPPPLAVNPFATPNQRVGPLLVRRACKSVRSRTASPAISDEKKANTSTTISVTGNNGDSQLSVNVMMYALGDKYDIKGMKHLARSKFQHAADMDWKPQDMAYAIEFVMETMPADDRDLWRIIVISLLKNPDKLKDPLIARLLEEGNGLAFDMVKVLLTDRKEPTAKPI